MLPPDSRKNELFLLVHSLDSREKTLYKRNNRPAGGRRALHLQLFGLIEQSTVNDEKSFMKKMGLTSASHFSGVKARLWQDLLALLTSESPKDHNSGLLPAPETIEALLGKNLSGVAGRLLHTTRESAARLEAYDLLLRLIPLQYRLLAYTDHKQYQKQHLQLLGQHQQYLHRFRLGQQLQVLGRELVAFKQFSYLRLNRQQLDRLQAIDLELQRLQVPTDSHLLTIQLIFNQCAAGHHTFQFGPAQAKAAMLLQYWEKYPHYIAGNAELFLLCADYCFYNAFALKDIAAAAEALLQYQRLAAANLGESWLEQWEIIVFHNQLKIYHKQAKYELVAQLVGEHAASVLNRIYKVLPPVTALSVVSSVCISYFVLEQYDKAEDLLIDVNAINRVVQKEDITYFIPIFHLLILFEKKAFVQLNHAISSAYFRLYNKKKLQPFERDLMLFLKHLANELSEDGRIRIIRSFLKQLETYRNDPVKDLYFLFFNYYGWLESKVQKIRYMEYMRRQLNRSAT